MQQCFGWVDHKRVAQMCTSVRGVEASGAKFSAHREGDVGARYTNYSPCNGSRKGKRPLRVTSSLMTNAVTCSGLTLSQEAGFLPAVPLGSLFHFPPTVTSNVPG